MKYARYRHSLLPGCLLCCGFLIAPPTLRGGDVPAPDATGPAAPAATAPATPEVDSRDPFTTTDAMRALADRGQPLPPAGDGPPPQLPALPELTLRGLLIDDLQPAIGLLQVGASTTHLVRPGDRIHLRSEDTVSELHIVDVDSRGIWVEIDQRNRTFLVR